MSFVVAAVAYGLWWLLGKKAGGAGRLWFLRPALLVMASASLANTVVGIWAARLLRSLFGLAGSIAHVSGALVAGGIFLLLAVGTVLDLKDKRPDGLAKTGLILLPILALVAAGPLASNGSGLFDAIAGAANHSIGTMIGG